jgi:capsular polysaccharide transport system ATP-binding protein
MIDVQTVTKCYATNKGPHVVLDRVNLSIPHGVNMGILGVNGAGKSTLLRIMSGAEVPDAGQVRRTGRISWPIGFGGSFNGSLSGEENCRFVARIYDEDVDRVVGFAQDFSELGDYFYMPVKTYSSGMKGRLAFALSMAVDFDVYLIDEVTAVGDAAFQKKCREAFAERRGRSSVIMVSHQPTTIRTFCERAAVLRHGQLTVYDSVPEAERSYQAT